MSIQIDRCPEDLIARYRREGYLRGELLSDLVRPWAEREPDRTALVYGTQTVSYGELDRQIDRLATGLYELGIRREDRVVLQLPNVPAFAVASIALFRLGAVPVFALPNHRRAELIYLCDYAEAVALIIVDRQLGFDYRTLAREVKRSVKVSPHVIVAGDSEEFISLAALAGAPRSFARAEPSDVAFFLLSGGTTGMPKLIPRTHDDYAYQLQACAEALEFGPDGAYLAALPIAHNAALGCPGLLGALRAGAKTVLLNTPSPDEAFPAIAKHGVTLTTLMPPLVRLWVDGAPRLGLDFSRLIIQVGSQRFPPELARRVRDELGARLSQWFGMAEGLLTYTRLNDPNEVIDHSQGRPLCPADELRVVDAEGKDVRPGEVGELITRGPYTLRGYYKAAEHNKEAFTEDGFLRTGDLVRITAEGNMVVEGRIKDVINRGGEKITAGEVEDLLVEHPAVREAAVVAMQDPTLGERIAAFVVIRESAPSLKDLKQFLKKRGLAEYKLPERLEVLDALPKTKVGKVDKGALRQLTMARPSP